MAKILALALALLALSGCDAVRVQPPRLESNVNSVFVIEAETESQDQHFTKQLESVYGAEIGVREATGNNDGEQVEKYLASVGMKKGNPWCAAFVHWCLEEAGHENKITGYSPSAYVKERVVWKSKWKRSFVPGQVFTLYYSKLGRIGHTGFADRLINENMIETVEGNTNIEGSREGDGIYRKKRSLNSLFSICEFRH